MINKKEFYNNLPKPAQLIAFNLYGLLIQFKRYNLTFLRMKNYIQNKELDENLESHKNGKLLDIYKSAKKTKYWKKLFDEMDIQNYTAFKTKFHDLPIMDKKTINNQFDFLYKKKILKAKAQSSGSTGNATKIFRNLNFEPIQWSFWWRYRNNLGIKRNEWAAVFSSKMISSSKKDLYRKNYLTKQVYFNSYLLNEENAISILQTIKKLGIKWVHGFPSSIAIIANTNKDYQILSQDDLHWVTTGGENLTLNQRLLIETSFKCKVREHYGLSEGVVNISECRNGHLHVDEDFSYVEFIASDFGGYHLVGTSYYNTVMPLIRYDTGDLVNSYKESQCIFHRGRIVNEIDGRQDDYIILKDGSKLGRLSILFSPFTCISESQIIQETENKVNIYISVSNEYTNEVEKKFKEHIQSFLLNRIEYEIIYTSNFIKTSNSKHRLVIRKLGEKI